MLFNSIHFAIFFPIVFFLYWFLTNKNLQIQNGLLLVSSYFFYACWDWRFLFLLMFSTLLDFFTAIKMTESKNEIIKKIWFWLSISVNLGFFCFFKYFDFFSTSFAEAASNLGLKIDPWTLKLILPVGISFYTFHGLSYIIDIYFNRVKAERNFITYGVFVSFFPLLVAGPIERAHHLLPQIQKKRNFNYQQSIRGLQQILWGLFKKIVIAYQCAKHVDFIFNHAESQSGSTLAVGAVLFAFQIYGDFSGYSDIALGTARLLGIDLLRNFAYPFFSRNIAEFWRRWHISLATWFRDYVYIPLGGSRCSNFKKIRNVLIVFLLSGFWHGANWTFIIWGLLNAIYILPSIIFKTNRNYLEIVAKGKSLPSLKEIFSIVLTFCLSTFAWIFFRSHSLHAAIVYIEKIFSASLLTMPTQHPAILFLLIIFLLLTEWLGREKQFAIADVGNNYPRIFRWGFYYLIIFSLFYFKTTSQQFIYFQF